MSDDGVSAPGHGYRKGPVLLRGQQIPTTTSDQRLLSGEKRQPEKHRRENEQAQHGEWKYGAVLVTHLEGT